MATRVRPSDQLHQRIAMQAESIQWLQTCFREQRRTITECLEIAEGPEWGDPQARLDLIAEKCRRMQE